MKIKLKEVFVLCIILTFFTNLFPQDNFTDSLKDALKNAHHDSIRCKILNQLIENEIDDAVWPIYNEQIKTIVDKNFKNNSSQKLFYKRYLAIYLNNVGFLADQMGDNKKALDYYNQGLVIEKEIKNPEGIAASLVNIGGIYEDQGEISQAMEYYFNALKIMGETKNESVVAHALMNIAGIYQKQGDIQKALEYNYKALKIREEIKDNIGIANTLNNLGLIYEDQKDISKALELYTKCLNLCKKNKDLEGIAHSLNAIGGIYEMRKDTRTALDYYNQSLKIMESLKMKDGVASSLNYIGCVYNNQGDFEKALEYHQKSLKLREEIMDKDAISQSLLNIGETLYKLGKTNESLQYTSRSLELSKEMGFPENVVEAANILKKIYIKQNKYKEAFKMYEVEMQMRDSIFNENTRKSSIQKQFQYQYEKKAAADSVKVAEEKKIVAVQLKQEKTQRFALYGGLALVALFAVFMFNRFKVTQNQKNIIELKEKETQIQKNIIEEKHKEITDSINYAERIQRTFLASKELLDANLSTLTDAKTNEDYQDKNEQNYFIFFKPKDVVSGDFYWAGKLNNGQFALVTADSTGHGVPGAIMSLLNVTSLEKAIEHYHNPADILNHTRQTIINRLKKDGSSDGGKDGMDCSLIVFDFANKQLHIAAANNPVWIIRNNTIIEIKPDKIPVGRSDKDHLPFTMQTIEVVSGDCIYTLTDGFPDQFGGPKGKKFMSKNLKELLLKNVHLPIQQQQQELELSFNNWVGDLEQVDDVCIIGIRI
ncbi:MAG: hypothetical protein C0448_02795 [Sphingobacteriaceae bacterium]|nr:hypothetical protein [Sphingobacteriaceae bacterium]